MIQIVFDNSIDLTLVSDTGRIPLTTEQIDRVFGLYNNSWERGADWRYEWRFTFNSKPCLIHNYKNIGLGRKTEGRPPLEWVFVGENREEVVAWLLECQTLDIEDVWKQVVMSENTNSPYYGGSPGWCLNYCKCGDCDAVYKNFITIPYAVRPKLARWSGDKYCRPFLDELEHAWYLPPGVSTIPVLAKGGIIFHEGMNEAMGLVK